MDVKKKSPKISNATKYVQLTDKLSNLIQSRNYDKKMLQTYLADLTEIECRSSLVDDNMTMLLVNNLCAAVQPSDTELVRLNCRFLINVLKKGVIFHGVTFMVCYRWILESLKFSKATAHGDVLLALQCLVNFGPWDTANKELKKVFMKNGPLWEHMNPESNEWNECNFFALSCLETFIIKVTQSESSEPLEYLPDVQHLTVQILCHLTHKIIDPEALFNKTACLCLRISRILVSDAETSTWPDMTGEILGILQIYLFHGIKGYALIKPEILRPAPMNLPEREQPIPKRSTFFQHKARDRRQRMKKSTIDNRNGTSGADSKTNIQCSSDSETSDTELGSPMDWKVRLRAVQLFQALIRVIPSNEMFGYWTQIIAIGSGTNPRVLSRWLLKAHDSKPRQLAFTMLTELLEEARKFLLHAEEIEHSSFLPFFGMVSDMIKELHVTLSLLSSTIRHKIVLTQVLKCAGALAQSTPYSRMKPGLATKLIRNCRIHLLHSDPTIRVAVLLVFEAIASADPMTKEILSILEKSSVIDVDSDFNLSTQCGISDIELEEEEEEEEEEEGEKELKEKNEASFNLDEDSEEKSISSLVRICLHNISNKLVHDPVRIQSLRLLGTLASNATNLIFSHIEIVAATLVAGMQASEHQIVLHTCRVVETMSTRLSSPELSNIDPMSFWNVVFDSVIGLAQHSQVVLREAACNCLSSLGSDMLSLLSREKIILIITVLFGSARDEESAVRAAGIRALGVLVTASIMEEDAGFLMDLADITSLATRDPNLGVRVKAIWALASLCDCLLRRDTNMEIEPVPLELIIPKLYEASVNAGKDNNKVKSNAVRAIGTILCLCSEKEMLKDTTEGLSALTLCASKGFDMKLRWNACHALGLVLSRKPDLILPLSWKDEVFPVLCNLISDFPNFKVRINAAWALSVCTSFGKYIPMLWKSIILALENSRHVPNYIEYAHHDGLVQQLCLAFCHVALYTELTELCIIWSEIGENIKDISPFIKHFQLHVLPEKSGDLMNAKIHFDNFSKVANTLREKQIAESLLQLFERADVFDNMDIPVIK